MNEFFLSHAVWFKNSIYDGITIPKKFLAKKSDTVLCSTDSLSAAQLIFSSIKYGMKSNLCELSLIALEEDLWWLLHHGTVNKINSKRGTFYTQVLHISFSCVPKFDFLKWKIKTFD